MKMNFDGREGKSRPFGEALQTVQAPQERPWFCCWPWVEPAIIHLIRILNVGERMYG